MPKISNLDSQLVNGNVWLGASFLKYSISGWITSDKSKYNIHYICNIYIIHLQFTLYIFITLDKSQCANYSIYNISLLSFKENSSKMTILGTHGTNQSVTNLHLLHGQYLQ